MTIGLPVYRRDFPILGESLAFQLDYFSKNDPYLLSHNSVIPNTKLMPEQYPRFSYKDAVEFCAPFGICES